MGFRAASRGQSVQVGVVILFGFVVIALSVYQATVIPAQNAQVEFNHNQDVQDDVIDVRNGILAAGTTGESRPTGVRLGTTYPSRTLFINPPPPSGTLRTTAPETVTVRNATAPGDAGDFWNRTRNFSTRAVVYQPNYNEQGAAPSTVYDNTVVYNRFETNGGTTLPRTDQRVVDGDRITLVTVNGSLSASQSGTVTVDPSAVSPVRSRETVTGNITIVIPTALDSTTWRTLLEEELADGWVENVTDARGGTAVAIELNESRSYQLGVARVSVGSDANRTRVPGYVAIDDAPSSTPSGETEEVVVRVRDQYGNPLQGVTVNGSADLGGFVDGTVTTDADGRAVFQYEPSGTGTATLNFTTDADVDPTAAGFDPSTTANASVTTDVTAGGTAYDVRWDTTAIEADNPSGVTYHPGNDTLVIDRSEIDPDRVTMTANATDDGDAVTGVNVDFASNDTTVASFVTSAADTDTNGQATVDMDVPNDGIATVYASANEDGDTLRVKVVSGGGGGGGTMATQTQVTSSGTSNPGGGPAQSVLVFSLENTGGSQVTITGIAINGTTSSAVEIDRAGPEFEQVSGGSGSLDQTLPIPSSQTPLDTDATIAAGGTADFELGIFRDSGGAQVDLRGESVTLTLYFADGSEKTITLSL